MIRMKNLFPLLVGCFLFVAFPAVAQMSDAQIANYAKQGMSSGKDMTQIAQELMAKGVSSEQLQKLYQQYGGSSGGMDASSLLGGSMSGKSGKNGKTNANTRLRTGERDGKAVWTGRDEDYKFDDEDMYYRRGSDSYYRRGDDRYYRRDEDGYYYRERMMDDRGNGYGYGYGYDDDYYYRYRDMEYGRDDNMPAVQEYNADGTPKLPKKIFGQDIFKNSKKLSFEPNENVATPSNYVIGPGDEIYIDIWGTSEATIQQTVSPDGRIIIPQIGPVQISGMTIEKATKILKNILSQKYSLSGEEADSKISVTLGNIRTIQVNVLGEVNAPGTYRLSALTTIFNAIYRAGGNTEVGSLRQVSVFRNGEYIATSDLYKFIFDGSTEDNIPLREGDAIIVPPYERMVEITGGVKRPMCYESVEGESVSELLLHAGGFSSDASTETVTIERHDGQNGRVYTIPAADFDKFALKDGDKVTVYTNAHYDLFENKVEITGPVVRPGVYALGSEIATVRQLVEHAGGLLEETFLSRAQIVREKDDRSKETIAVPIGAIMDGTAQDILMKRNDELIVFDKNLLEPKGDLTITGYVIYPGDYPYAEGTTIEDLIVTAGGLQSGASTARVDVSRRIDISSSTHASDTLAAIFSFNIKDGLIVDGKPGFTLRPFDIVSVRKSPTYVPQKQVKVTGEVTFPGDYTLVSNNERISDLYKRAGMGTPNAYIAGATLKRKLNDMEKNANKALALTAINMNDTATVAEIMSKESYSVGIDLKKAMTMPGSDYDIVLFDGDELIIPPMSSIVKIEGEVLRPNAVSFISGKPVSYYIDMAGGFSEDARRSKVYVVHMNGNIDKGTAAKVDAGSLIVVPARPTRRKMTVGEWLGLGSTAASITTMVVTIANMINK